MEQELRAILVTNKIPDELTIRYDDMHGLWGGTTITLLADGGCERKTKELGAPEARVEQKQIPLDQLVELVRFIVELRLWEQQTEDDPPVADESRACLTISFKDEVTRIWERVNDMTTNNRLVHIKTRLEKL